MRERRDELACFLKSRRYRLTPGDVGLPRNGRRRITTLRREEVAWLADVGITWYTWLEQGRPIKMGHGTLKRVAAALRMDCSEAEYLERLVRPQDRSVTGQLPLAADIRAFVEGYSIGYACVLSPRRDVVACNDGFAHLFGIDDGIAEGCRERNLLWIIFTNERLRSPFPDWRAVARDVLATFRFAYAEYVGEAAFETLIATLIARSEEFASMWADVDVLSPTRWNIGAMTHPLLKTTAPFQSVTLVPPDASCHTLCFHFPTRPGEEASLLHVR